MNENIKFTLKHTFKHLHFSKVKKKIKIKNKGYMWHSQFWVISFTVYTLVYLIIFLQYAMVCINASFILWVFIQNFSFHCIHLFFKEKIPALFTYFRHAYLFINIQSTLRWQQLFSFIKICISAVNSVKRKRCLKPLAATWIE